MKLVDLIPTYKTAKVTHRHYDEELTENCLFE